MTAITPIIIDKPTTLDADVVIIGTGAGGATTAKMLTKAGLNVIMLEEGGYHHSSSFNGSIADLMDLLYRDGGVSPIMGRPAIPFAEGRCVGGTTVINGGVYWRTPDKLLSRWSNELNLPELTEAILDPHFNMLADELGVTAHHKPGTNQPSNLLAQGCDKLGWRYSDVPRGQKNCQNSNRCPTGCPNAAKQSMLVSYVPMAVQQGARLVANARAERINIENGRATGVAAMATGSDGQRHMLTIHANATFVCAGPMQTPFILRRSGVKTEVGHGLQLHLNLKAVAIFPQDISPAMGTVMSKQVKEFDDRDLFICSSTFDPVYLALALAAHGQKVVESVMSGWQNASIYVAQVKADTSGQVHALPMMDRPMPTYSLTKNDISNFRFAIEQMGEVLLASGAKEIYLPIAGTGPVRTMSEVRKLAQGSLNPRALDLVSVHAMSSCRLGTALDAFGQVKGVNRLFVNDASMLPEATGVNPQMTIMAIAMRNALAFLDNKAAA
ncbi:MAG: GMC family oxidoreductase [Alphaproteobacteria bacterium]|nr:GMC family oxidoreductase [Alphaproteobacteria bacterium]